MHLLLVFMGGVVAMGLAHMRRPVANESAVDESAPSELEAYKRHRDWLLTELSRPDLKTFAILAFNIGIVTALFKDAKVLIPQLFFVPTVVSGAVSCLCLLAALWSRQAKQKVKTPADLRTKIFPTVEQLEPICLALEKILRKKHFFFNWSLRASAIMTTSAFTGMIA